MLLFFKRLTSKSPIQRKTKFSAPIACGYNIHKFDLPISDRLCAKHAKSKEIFHPRDKIDLMHWILWFLELQEIMNQILEKFQKYLVKMYSMIM